MKLFCATSECKYNDDHNQCTAHEVYLNDLSIMTVWEGRQHLWKCRQFEMSDDAKRICEEFERYAYLR